MSSLTISSLSPITRLTEVDNRSVRIAIWSVCGSLCAALRPEILVLGAHVWRSYCADAGLKLVSVLHVRTIVPDYTSLSQGDALRCLSCLSLLDIVNLSIS